MMTIDPATTPTKDLHQFLLGIVSPRPIAWVSTIDENGNTNLAPYSFFNAFSSNPPILVFSSNRRVADNTTKDTLANIEANGECVIHAVSYKNLRQMAVSSVSFPTNESEFEKAGLTAVKSDLVKPFRVEESPAAMECKVTKIITLGDQGGAGHLILCNVVRIHLDEEVVENNRINPNKMDLMGRLGRAYYVRVKGENVFPVVQSVMEVTIGYDNLPDAIKKSTVFNGNNIGQLAGLKEAPSAEAIAAAKAKPIIAKLMEADNATEVLQIYAKEILDMDDNRRMEAAAIAWLS